MAPQLYLDMDGVLADFDRTASRILGMDSYKFDFVHGSKEFWKRLDAVPDLFNTFDPMPDAHVLWANVEHLKPRILTALPKTGAVAVASQKMAWIKRHFGSQVTVITCITEDKPRYCNAGDILVDDRTVNREAWTAAGGRFIFHTSAADSIYQLIRLGVL